MLRTLSLRTIAIGAALLSAIACGGDSGGTTPTPTVQSISVSPSTATLTAAGEVTSLSAQVRLSDGSVGTQSVTWSSTNPAVATVSGGTVTAVSSGQTTINATTAGITGSASITVAIPTVQTVTVTPATATLTAVAQTRAMTAEVRLSNGALGSQTPTWSSTNTSVATVSAAGVVTAVASGQTNIVATVGAITGQAAITVAIPVVQTVTVSPATATLTAAGATTPLTAEVRMSNGALGTQTPTWSSSNPSVATVSNAGVVTAVASGQTNIVATVGAITGQAAITVAIPVVQTVTVTPATTTLVSLGATVLMTAEVRLSNGAVGAQTPTWTSSNPAVATINGRTVTAVANGTTTITASVGAVSGTATITVSQVVASVRLLPTDTVIKSAAQVRGAALDARGNVIANAPLQFTAVTPLITTVSQSGALTPQSTGVARVQVSSGNFTATSIVRTVWNVTRLSDLYPLFEYSASAGQRRALSDINQNHADARATMMGNVWTYLESILPSGGSAVTEMYFTSWTDIWLAATPFCGGVLIPNSVIYQVCTNPTWIHLMVPGNSPNDFTIITRFLARQFLLNSMTTSNAFPWFLTGYSQWLGGGSFQGAAIVGGPNAAHIADFRNGDTLNLLAHMDTLVNLPALRFNEGIELRTPVAVRQAQSVIFVHFLNREFPTLLPAILARIRATPGATFTNEHLKQEIEIRTGKTMTQLNNEYLVYARTLR